jgi:putative flippase GtrA
MRSDAHSTAGSGTGLARLMLKTMPQLSRYSVASVLALGLDFWVFLALVGAGWSAPLAGVVGYAIGMTAHFSLSTRFVFAASRVAKPEARLFAEFALSGLVGLAITAAVIAAATELFHVSALAAKVLAAGTSFVAVYLVRRRIVFSAHTNRPLEP